MLELAPATIASLVAGFVNAIAGGGGLISLAARPVRRLFRLGHRNWPALENLIQSV